MPKDELIPYLVIWAVTALVLVIKSWRSAGAGLVLSYCFQLFLLYWLGAMLHGLPWADLPDTDFVLLGFEQSTHALIAFAIGSFAITPFLAARIASRPQDTAAPDPKLPRTFIVIGTIFYFVVAPTLGQVAGFNAIGAVGSQMVVVGISLNCWMAWCNGGVVPLLKALAPAFLIPVATLTTQGFLSFGIIALSTVIMFSAQFFRPRWILFAAGLLFAYVGLTGYGAYMRDRDINRAIVWGGESIANRLAGFWQTIATAEWYDWNNPDHLAFVDNRLNQNVLVGNAVTYLSNTGNYAYGSTLADAALNMIPRLIWPGKPTAAGSHGLAARFTGLEFAQGTSIGVGPVMELYGNFGSVGIWIGFICLGCLIQAMDVMAGFHLRNCTWLDFANWYLVGISFLNVSGSFVECTAGAVASLVLASTIRRALRTMSERRQVRKQEIPATA